MTAVWFLLAAMIATGMRALLLELDADVSWGTLTVNLSGSFLLGVLVGGEATPFALAVGGLGSLTTWSRFLSELVEHGNQPLRTIGYLVVSIGGGVGLAWAGLQLAG